MPLPSLPQSSPQDANFWRRHRETINNILNHNFDDSKVRTAAEVAAGVTPVNQAYPPGDIRRYGAQPVDDTSGAGFDSTYAIQTSLNLPIPTIFPDANWLFSNLTTPNEKTIIFGGTHTCNLICKTGSTGTMFTDQGNAAKISMYGGVTFYANSCNYSHLFYLGHGGVAVHGTEGYLEHVMVRDGPTGVPGIDILCNVGHYGRLLVQDTGGIQVLGTSIMCDKVQCYGATGFDVGGTNYGANFGDGQINIMEIEAPANGVIPLLYSGNFSIDNLTISFADAANTHAHLIELSASSTTWRVGNFKLYFKTTGPTITNGNFKRSDGSYFGGNASSKNAGGEGNYASETLGLRPQAFCLRITNTAGTMQHFIDDGNGNVAKFASLINSASPSLTTTPNGADNVTAMAAGGKIGGTSPSIFWLDVPNQKEGYADLSAPIVLNSSGTALTCVAYLASININGVTRVRVALQFYDTTLTAFALTTANIAAGKIVQVQFRGEISP